MDTVNFKLDKNAILPQRQTNGSAGYDLYLNDNVYVQYGGVTMAHTGVHAEIPKGYVGLLFIRSSIGAKKNISLATGVSVIDSDYRGEISIPLYNHSDKSQGFKIGERIAQLVIVPCLTAQPKQVDELSDTERAEGGFGSTGRE